MLRKGLKQTRILYGPAIYEMTVFKDHYFRKLDDYLDWKRTDTVCRYLYSENSQQASKEFSQDHVQNRSAAIHVQLDRLRSERARTVQHCDKVVFRVTIR